MELKTKVHAVDGKQELQITRDFDLPVELLFRAYVEPELVEQWMGTRVIKLENRQHGSYHFITTDPKGLEHGFNGVIHEIIPNQRIIRTFEMENGSMGAQLEFLEFAPTSATTSFLRIHIIFRSVEIRDQLLKLPFAQGLNMAHNRLQEAAGAAR
ncbi:MAG: SRPBCC domain-containing protein [Saprospiraceae bacterium]